MRELRAPKRRQSVLLRSGLLALLSTPALADSGWDEVGALLLGITCLILIIATAVTIFATSRVAIAIDLLVVAGMSWLLAGQVVGSVLDVWAFIFACFVGLTIACVYKLWRPDKDSGTPPPPSNTSLERTREG
jgi:hypothetical protein